MPTHLATRAALIFFLSMGFGPAAAQSFVGKYDATKSFDGFETRLEITAAEPGGQVRGKAAGQTMRQGAYFDYSYTLGDQTAANQAQAYISGSTLVVRFPSGAYYTLQQIGENLQGAYTNPTLIHMNRSVVFTRLAP